MRTQAGKFLRALPLAAFLFGSMANGQVTQTGPAVSLGTPQYSGTGCPSYTVSSAISPDGGALSILFDNFVVSTDRYNPIVRKTCNMAVPVQVPTGYQVSIIGIDYRGFNSLPTGGSADFSVEYFFAGGSTPPFTTTFHGPLTENYLLQDTLDATRLSWSSCGGSNVLRINNAMVVSANSAGDQAMSTVDSIEVTVSDPNRYAGMIFHLNWQTCTTISNGASSVTPNALLFTGLVGTLAWLAGGI